RDMREELGRPSRREEHVERVRACHAWLGGTEDRLRLAFHANVDDRSGREAGKGEGGRDDRKEHKESTKHESSFREGFEMRGEATGLLTRGSLPHRLPRLAPSGVVAEKRLPLQRRDRPGLAPEFPYRSPV